MCGEEFSRLSQGGVTAVLWGKGLLPLNTRITLQNSDNETTTRATMEKNLHERCSTHGSYSLVIHRSGDLTCTGTRGPPLYCIPFNLSDPEDAGSSLSLPIKLDLGFGATGIIGRKLSLMKQKEVLAEGIIGWN